MPRVTDLGRAVGESETKFIFTSIAGWEGAGCGPHLVGLGCLLAWAELDKPQVNTGAPIVLSPKNTTPCISHSVLGWGLHSQILDGLEGPLASFSRWVEVLFGLEYRGTHNQGRAGKGPRLLSQT